MKVNSLQAFDTIANVSNPAYAVTKRLMRYMPPMLQILLLFVSDVDSVSFSAKIFSYCLNYPRFLAQPVPILAWSAAAPDGPKAANLEI